MNARRFKGLHRCEDMLLATLLGAVILLATTQILLRNLFDLGLVWIDPLLRAMVLWLGMVGAAIASRENRHIRIDLLSRFFRQRVNLAIQGLVTLFCAGVCLLLAWYGAQWVRFEHQDRLTGAAGIPVWQLEVVIPLSFALMGLRYGFASSRIARYFYRRYGQRIGQRYRPLETEK